MHKFTKILLLPLVLCFWQPLRLDAQHVGGNPGPCPGGSAPVNGSCGSPSNANSGAQRQSTEVWKNYYGALAATTDGTIVGSANNQKSYRAARKLALNKCAEATCRVVVEYVNSCGSVARGLRKDGTRIRSYGSGVNVVESDQKALKICNNSTGGACTVEFTGCSLPVRVQ